MRILLGYDGSDCADAAIEDLARAGIGSNCEVLVLSGVDVWPHLPASSFQELDRQAMVNSSLAVQRAHKLAGQAMEEARELAKQGAERIRKTLPDAKVKSETRPEAPATALLSMAEQWKPDLLVVGSHGRSALGRAMLGSVSQTVVTHAPCSVRVARRRKAPAARGVRLIVGVDGSSDSAAAVSAIAMRSWPADTDVVVLVALDVRLALAMPAIDQKADEGTEMWVKAMAEGAAEELRRAGLGTETMLRYGDPKKVLVEEARAVDTDCIFVGARGFSRVQRLLLGSVSAAVSARAECSVEVVRSGS
ncbi:MAG TPA: universal stress protein [Tepidisphaeraceae bacterium]|nr:universal stress protein [Tepidisphaeraceae bacterium]